MNTTKKLKPILLIITILFLFIVQVSQAHFGSKGPYGGSVTCGIVNDTLVYIGTAEGGVYISTNSLLVTWSPKPVGMKSGKITALVHTGKYVFAATADSGIFRYTGFIGSDRYWEKVNTGLTNLNVTSMVAIDSITVLAGTDGGGLFKTTNKGGNWTAINSVPLNGKIIPSMVKAGTRIILTTLNGGVFKSDDDGASWQDFNDVNTLNIAGSISLSYNAVTDELLVINNNGLFKAGIAGTASSAGYMAAQSGLPSNTTVRSISNNGTDWFLATDKGAYSSSSGAINWSAQNTGLAILDVTAIIPFQTRLVAGTNNGGIYKSPNSGITWSANNNGFNNLTTFAMVTQGVTLVIAATGKGVHVSNDLAASYKILNKGLTDSLNVTDLGIFGTKLLAGTKNGGFFVSADTGKNWSAFNTGLTNLYIKKIITSSGYVYVFDATGIVYQSDLSSGWTSIQSGLPGSVTPTSLAFYNSKMLLGTYGNGVFERNESSGNWSAFGTGLTNNNVNAVTALVTGTGIKLFAGTDGLGVFIADASSGAWTTVSPVSISHTATMGLNGQKIQAMAVLGGYVFASYKGGLLATTDNGATWIAGGNQFNLPSYTNVKKISFVTTRVFVTTDNNGLYSNSLSELPLLATINSATQVSCHSSCNGAASVTGAAGSGTYTYAWSNGATTSTINNVCAGTYSVIVSAGAVADTATVTISQPTALSVSISTTPSSGTNGTATANVTGGTTGYTYSWSNGGTTSSISGLAPDNYTVTVTDNNGCTDMKSQAVSIVNGIESFDSAEDILIFPNPNNGNFTIACSRLPGSIKNISVFDVTGKLMEELALVNEKSFTVNYPKGIYFIRVSTQKGIAVKKLVIE